MSNATDDRWWSSDDPTPDEVVVTTTDYLPGHSEKLTISKIDRQEGDLDRWGHLAPPRNKIPDREPIGNEQPSAFSTPAWIPT